MSFGSELMMLVLLSTSLPTQASKTPLDSSMASSFKSDFMLLVQVYFLHLFAFSFLLAFSSSNFTNQFVLITFSTPLFFSNLSRLSLHFGQLFMLHENSKLSLPFL